MKTEKIKWIKVALLLIFIGNFIPSHAQQLMETSVVGKGNPMILIHGMSSSSAVWKDVVARYSPDYELHLVHVKGFGNKEYVESDHYLEQLKDELIGYVKGNQLQKPILMGHSMGGFISLWAAAEAPGLFGKIISIDGVPYFPVLQMPGITPESAKPIVESMTASFANMDESGARANQEMIVATMIATENRREEVVEMGMASHPKVTGQAYGEMFTTDIRPLMHQIKEPVLLFGAWAAYQNYGATKASVMTGYEAQMKDVADVKIALAEKGYHFVFYDEPQWFFDEVDAFLAD
ncbi:alpha/beta fold hydrolase [Pararhodonellum marinum]|uniref:alpha/beta fold hydrolase n=1 Tax=Pararhodonellum marinum TaxID=2755358 RepID=UPI00189084D5|nr:alpha/beta hydrolase [Pararhodonellum marinum]